MDKAAKGNGALAITKTSEVENLVDLGVANYPQGSFIALELPAPPTGCFGWVVSDNPVVKEL